MTSSPRTQVLGVSQRRDERGNEGLVYAPARVLGRSRSQRETAWQPIKTEVLEWHLDNLRHRTSELVELANAGRPRDDVSIASEADALAAYALPTDGLVGLIEPDLNPHFDIAFDAASTIPWELLDEFHGVCNCRTNSTYQRISRNANPPACPHCKQPMTKCGGHLATERVLTHHVRGGCVPLLGGTEFLLVEDPTWEFCGANDAVREHLRKVQAILERLGFGVVRLAMNEATARRFIEALENPRLAGLYFFGTGHFAQNAAQGCLVLSDGTLQASELESAGPNLKFAFLNTCCGETTLRWNFERRPGSVGYALACAGPSRTVISTLFPLPPVQAAQAAVSFFEQISAGVSTSSALMSMRRQSAAKYDKHSAELAWMGYRFFGDADAPFPRPEAGGAQATSPAAQVFVGDRLNHDAFGFDIQGALTRAAKRRRRHNRSRIGALDLIAGLIRTGDLTRYLLRSLRIDPDAVYQELQLIVEEEPVSGGTAAATPNHSGIDAGTVAAEAVVAGTTQDFTPNLIDLLLRAAALAKPSRQRGVGPVSEHALLNALTEDGRWRVAARMPLPNADSVRQWLERRDEEHVVDANGQLMLASLSPLACRIVHAAHELSQQRGARSILNRLLLAAFLNEPGSQIATSFRRNGINSATMAVLLSAATSCHAPLNYALSPEAARRVVLPMLDRARSLQAEQQHSLISESVLFQAFCDVVPSELKQALRRLPPPFALDLDRLRDAGEGSSKSNAGLPSPDFLSSMSGLDDVLQDEEDLSHQTVRAALDATVQLFDTTVQHAIFAAHEYALVQGYSDIRSMHLAVGLISLRTKLIVTILRQRQMVPERVSLALLRMVRPKELDDDGQVVTSYSETTRRIMERAIAFSHTAGRITVTENMLWRAVLTETSGIVAQALQELDLYDLLWHAVSQD